MVIGYGRVSTIDQNPDLQLDALKKAGCKKIYIDKASGKSTDRPQLQKMLELLREEDIVIVWKFSRLSRSLTGLIDLLNQIREKQATFICLSQNIDSSTATGRFFVSIIGAFDEFEREIKLENTMAGLASARARGRVGGRPKGLSKTAEVKAAAAKTLYLDGNSPAMIMAQLGIRSKQTLYRWLRLKGVPISPEEKKAT